MLETGLGRGGRFVRRGLFELDAIVGIAVRVGKCAAAEADADQEGRSPEVDVLHDGWMWIRAEHALPYGHESEKVTDFLPKLPPHVAPTRPTLGPPWWLPCSIPA